ncbi:MULTISPECIES: hypothetical protein [unclassified Streptomyces]|uniref:hypothetical protein n=1 Tax=unclassified Streptomyces TaxID=2593676 RepID=UPI0035D6BC06
MGYLRRTSFLSFHDPDAPTEEKTLDQKEIAEIEAVHEAGKTDRVDALIRRQSWIRLAKLHTEEEQREALRHLARREGVSVPDEAMAEVLIAAIVENRKQELEGLDQEEAQQFQDEGRFDPSAILAEFPTDEATARSAAPSPPYVSGTAAPTGSGSTRTSARPGGTAGNRRRSPPAGPRPPCG